jgi:hypothetical protein
MSWWQYLLLVNLYLVLFYGFYALLLRRETFFHLNRIFLSYTSNTFRLGTKSIYHPKSTTHFITIRRPYTGLSA